MLEHDAASTAGGIPLKAYGYRLGEFKGSFGKSTDWKEWSQEMEDYCVQDVNVTTKLWTHFKPYFQWVQMEHEVAQILQTQEEHGWHFDEAAAWELTSTLQQELRDTEKLLRDKHPFVRGSSSLLNDLTKHQGTLQNTFTKLKELLNLRDHISWILQTRKYGWKPTSEQTQGNRSSTTNLERDRDGDISNPSATTDDYQSLGMMSEGMNA